MSFAKTRGYTNNVGTNIASNKKKRVKKGGLAGKPSSGHCPIHEKRSTKMMVTQHLQKSAVTLLKQNGLRKMPKKRVKKGENFYL